MLAPLIVSVGATFVTLIVAVVVLLWPIESVTRRLLIRKLKERNARMLVGHRLLAVEKDGVRVADPDNRETKIAASRVVIAIGIRSNNTIHDQVKTLGYETHVIGDCLEPRTAKAAILDGARLGRSI